MVSELIFQTLVLHGPRTSVNWENVMLQILVCANLGENDEKS
jgi:hypothetical protein